MHTHKFLISVIVASSICSSSLDAMRHDFGDGVFGENSVQKNDGSNKSKEAMDYEAQLLERREKLKES